MDVFKENKGLIVITVIFGVLAGSSTVISPTYYSSSVALGLTILFLPLEVWWFWAFWNRILTKIFSLKQISFGLALLLWAGLTLIIY